MANDFEKIFEQLTRELDPNRVFNEFLDYCIDINLFSLVDQKLDFGGREKDYFKMFHAWINISNDKLNDDSSNGWYDYLGVFYEDFVQSKYKAGVIGQFFTPHHVCQIMTELSFDENKDYKNKLVNDCCCGSGRFLLAGHAMQPEAIMIGSDLDEMACKMSVLNFYLHGIRGSIIHQNALTGECFGAWRVNNYLQYGLPLPHIELVTPWEAYRFIGMENTEPLELDTPVQEKKVDVQTKLI